MCHRCELFARAQQGGLLASAHRAGQDVQNRPRSACERPSDWNALAIKILNWGGANDSKALSQAAADSLSGFKSAGAFAASSMRRDSPSKEAPCSMTKDL